MISRSFFRVFRVFRGSLPMSTELSHKGHKEHKEENYEKETLPSYAGYEGTKDNARKSSVIISVHLWLSILFSFGVGPADSFFCPHFSVLSSVLVANADAPTSLRSKVSEVIPGTAAGRCW